MIQKRNSAQRISHLQAMEQCKKDVISSRSGRTRSPSSGSADGQNVGYMVNRQGQLHEQTIFSLSTKNPHRRVRPPRHTRINTDLDEHDETLLSDGVQTQKVSIMQEMRVTALTPQIMDNHEIMIHQEHDDLSENQPVVDEYEN